jgi:hypothetical protein
MLIEMLAVSSHRKPSLPDDEYLEIGTNAATTCVPPHTEQPRAEAAERVMQSV